MDTLKISRPLGWGSDPICIIRSHWKKKEETLGVSLTEKRPVRVWWETTPWRPKRKVSERCTCCAMILAWQNTSLTQVMQSGTCYNSSSQSTHPGQHICSGDIGESGTRVYSFSSIFPSSLLIFWSVLSRLGLRRMEKEEEVPVSLNPATQNESFYSCYWFYGHSEYSWIIVMRQFSKDLLSCRAQISWRALWYLFQHCSLAHGKRQKQLMARNWANLATSPQCFHKLTWHQQAGPVLLEAQLMLAAEPHTVVLWGINNLIDHPL